ncbi:MAG: two-component system response regulator AtoC [Myxococcota bacterium]|jgi:two-component system response regulator AtoC
MKDRIRPDLKQTVFHGMFTCSPQMRSLFELIRRASNSDVTTLLRGESGSGKELVARALHAEGTRRSAPFRAVNCASFTSEMLASELFGHVKGAFTGAVHRRDGLLVQADKGTLFLDEVADIPSDLQGRLLRVLEERRFTPLGGSVERRVDIRIVSATNTGLRDLVVQRKFREDLMYRLRVVILRLPPLREREGDLELLTWAFIDRLNTAGGRQIRRISSTAWDVMQSYPWPGNIRELDNMLQGAFVLGEGPVLRVEDLLPELRGEAPPIDSIVLHSARPVTNELEELERKQLVEAWQRFDGSRGKMSVSLGISRSTLYRRLRDHQLI